MQRIVGLLGAKKISKRLPGKAWRRLQGKPMFEHNVRKGVEIFDKMYVSSDDTILLNRSEQMGAIPILRTNPKLMDAPNISYYKHALQFMSNPDAIVAIQVNSPTVNKELITKVKKMMLMFNEIKTCDLYGADYGSIWAMTIDRLNNYGDPYNAKPDVWVVDTSVDIHTAEDLYKAKLQL